MYHVLCTINEYSIRNSIVYDDCYEKGRYRKYEEVGLKIEPVQEGGMYLDKEILKEYVDACKLVEETEEDIKRLNKKKKSIIQTNVSGSNPEFPYQQKHFHIEGTAFTYQDDYQLRMEEKLLEKRKVEAEKIKLQVQQWMNGLSKRMQRIIRFRYFEEMSWEDVAKKMGRKATASSVRMEFERFLKDF